MQKKKGIPKEAIRLSMYHSQIKYFKEGNEDHEFPINIHSKYID